MFKYILFTILLTFQIWAMETIDIIYNTNKDVIQVNHYPNKADKLLIILPSEHGITDGLEALSKQLNGKGMEVWLADPFTTWFLPVGVSSLKKIPLDAYVAIIKKAVKTHKKIYLFSNDKGSSLLLNAINNWQENSDDIISGVLLLSPNLYEKTPTAGKDGVLLPITYATNMPIHLFLPEKSTLSLRVDDTKNALESSRSDVNIEVLKNVRDRFYFREDATEQEKKAASVFANNILGSMSKTIKYAKTRDSVKITKQIKSSKIVHIKNLDEYENKVIAQNFSLKDMNQKNHSLSKYKGQVVLLNFWASWCPPCVHEMPSMSQLNNTLKGTIPFSILAINLGEKKSEISEFLKKHKVSFDILLDPTQKQAKKWKVYAFPTSFLIDKKGIIRYSVAGGFDWNTKEIQELIKKLANEK